MGGPIADFGAASTVCFRFWVGSRQRGRAQVFRQARMEREENELLGRRAPDKAGTGADPGGATGKAKASGRKGGLGGGGGGAGAAAAEQ